MIWKSVLDNLAGIIVACTGFGAMITGFIIQFRMTKHQNERIDNHAAEIRSDIAAATGDPSARQVSDFIQAINDPKTKA